MKLLSLLSAAIVVVFFAKCSDARTVQVDVQMPWPYFASSPLVETAEYLHDRSNNLFWSYVDALCTESAKIDQYVDSNDVTSVRAVAYSALKRYDSGADDNSMSAEEMDVMRSSLAFGMYAPAVRHFESLSSSLGVGCGSSLHAPAVVVYPLGRVLCSAKEVEEYLLAAAAGEDATTGAAENNDWEHIFPTSDTSAIAARNKAHVNMELYGVIGSSAFCSLHKGIVATIGSSSGVSARYSVRHGFIGLSPVSRETRETTSDPAAEEAPFSSSAFGYGVHLDIKNMEYKAVDDGVKSTSVKDGEEGEEDAEGEEGDAGAPVVDSARNEFPPTEELMGINFHKLNATFLGSGESDKGEVAEKEELQKQLQEFRKQLLALKQAEQDASDGSKGFGTGGGGDSTDMKVWRIKDLGVQTVQMARSTYIGTLKARKEAAARSSADVEEDAMVFDAGQRLSDVVLNFPAMASSLSAVKVSRRLREQVEKWFQGAAGAQFGMMPPMGDEDDEDSIPASRLLPANTLFVNGLPVSLDAPSFNVFGLLGTVRREVEQLTALRNYLAPKLTHTEINGSALSSLVAGVKEMAYTASSSSSGAGSDRNGASAVLGNQGGSQHSNPFNSADVVRIDISKGAKYAVHFVNNLEKDAMYKQWTKSLRQLARPSWNLLLIARNLYTVVGIVQPLSESGSRVLSDMHGLVTQGLPVRFGFVLSCDDGPTLRSEWDDGEQAEASSAVSAHAGSKYASNADVCILYAKVKEQKGGSTAWAFVQALATEIAPLSAMDNGDGTMTEAKPSKYAPNDSDLEEEEKAGQRNRMLQVPLDVVAEIYSKAIGAGSSSVNFWSGSKEKQAALDLLTLGSRPSSTDTEDANLSSLRENYKRLGAYGRNTSAYIAARGLSANTITFNGIVLGGGAGGEEGGVDLYNGVMSTISREQYIMAQAYAYQIITERTKSIFSAVLESSKAYVRYHPILGGSGAGSESGGGEADPSKAVVYADLLNGFEKSASFLDSLPLFATASKIGGELAEKVPNTVLVSFPATLRGFVSASNMFQWLERKQLQQKSSDQLAAVVALPIEVENHLAELIVKYEGGNSDVESLLGELSQVEMDLLLFKSLQSSILTWSRRDGSSSNDVTSACRLMSIILRYLSRPQNFAKEVFVLDPHKRAVQARLREELVDVFALKPTADETTSIDVEIDGSAGQHDTAPLVTNDLAKELIDSIVVALTQGVVPAESMDLKSARRLLKEGVAESSQMRSFLSSHSGKEEPTVSTFVAESEVTVVYNSRIFAESSALSPSSKPLHSLDMDLFESIEQSHLSENVRTFLTAEWPQLLRGKGDSAPAYLGMYLSSFCGCYGGGQKRHNVPKIFKDRDLSPAKSTFMAELFPKRESSDSESSLVDIVYIFNPLSKAGQRAISLFDLFQSHLAIPQLLVMIPQLEITEFPLQNFYRFVLPRTGDVAAGAVFGNLPRQHTLTVRTDVPESWNVQTLRAVQDIDNLRCSKVPSTGAWAVGTCGDPVVGEQVTSLSDEDGVSSVAGNVELPGELTSVTYVLKNLVVGGQCFEALPSSYGGGIVHRPPAGLQIVMRRTVDNPAAPESNGGVNTYRFHEPIRQSDTLVMHNLGYFQLQANPGVWKLTLAPGRANSLYKIDGAFDGLPVVINSFRDVVKRVFVGKRAGREHIGLLDDAAAQFDSDGSSKGESSAATPAASTSADAEVAAAGPNGGSKSVWKSISSLWAQADNGDTRSFSGKAIDALKQGAALPEAAGAQVRNMHRYLTGAPAAGTVDGEGDDDCIHIFSLATGHMYERLLRIMMLSVTKRASMKVKFWLFENYLSPTFKASAALMAQQYGFEVGYVSYKWPAWLTQQSEKQRIIWGYKILFLDVLFPISVKRIIYVDADQVVRADLKELWDMDMDGKPYGYVPFCASRNETLGFQFWRQGFWKDHLRGRPYHISALYVVDLQNFRRHAVGDILRSTYDGLARDPNSLANLDQDLPNFAQHQVPIFSLPQEWLWCETWCDEGSKATAKTIDLCNNPLHKEPKLDMARRIINGPPLFRESWVQLDEEIDGVLTPPVEGNAGAA